MYKYNNILYLILILKYVFIIKTKYFYLSKRICAYMIFFVKIFVNKILED